MAKIDCTTVIGFVKEADRVCLMHEECKECPFSGRKTCPKAVLEYDTPDVQAIIDALQKWSDEHPVKTRLDDVKEKHPNIPTDDGAPIVAPWTMGYCQECKNCSKSDKIVPDCWLEPIDGGATGKAVE